MRAAAAAAQKLKTRVTFISIIVASTWKKLPQRWAFGLKQAHPFSRHRPCNVPIPLLVRILRIPYALSVSILFWAKSDCPPYRRLAEADPVKTRYIFLCLRWGAFFKVARYSPTPKSSSFNKFFSRRFEWHASTLWHMFTCRWQARNIPNKNGHDSHAVVRRF